MPVTQPAQTTQPTQPTQPATQAPEPTKSTQPTQTETDSFWTSDVDLGVQAPEGGSFKGLKPFHELVGYLPEEHRKQLYNIKADYTRKTTELAKERQEREQEKKNWMEERQKFLMLKPDKKPDSLITQDDVESGKATLEDFMAQQNDKYMYERMSRLEEQWQAEHKYNSEVAFIEANPEFQDKEFKLAVTELYKKGLDIEDAFYAVKGRGFTSSASRELEKSNADHSRRENLGLLTVGSRTPKEFNIPKGASAMEIHNLVMAYYKEHGEAPPMPRR